MLSELVRAVTGEEMPYATLMYVWCNTREPGEALASRREARDSLSLKEIPVSARLLLC